MDRLGIAIYDSYYGEKNWLSAVDIIECAKYADEEGLNSVWLNEDKGRDAIALLSLISAKTRQIKLATGIVNIYARSAMQIAMGVGTVHELSEGRAILGIGTGHKYSVTNGHGLPIENVVSRTREYVTLIRKALSGSSFTHQGRLFKLNSARLGFRPPSSLIPIYLAARNPNMIRLAGEIADGLLIFLAPPRLIESDVKEQLKEGAEKAEGRDPQQIDIACWIPCCLTEDSQHADYVAKRTIIQYTRNPRLDSVLWDRLGFLDSIQKVRSALGQAAEKEKVGGERLEKAIKLVPEELSKTIVLAGNENQIERGLQDYVSAGVKLPILMPMSFEEGKSEIMKVIRRSKAINSHT
jgi:alkanesulfonate monooxygenase SsuD/methylene tetrahydromethanopterin reductase-like flavin-dependent oxidoreductase (luciferase family)